MKVKYFLAAILPVFLAVSVAGMERSQAIWKVGGDAPVDPTVKLTQTAEWVATPRNGNGLEFHGNGSTATIPGFPQREYADLTLSLFFRVNEYPRGQEDGGIGEGALVSNGYDWLVRCYSGGRIYVGFRTVDGELNGMFCDAKIELNHWNHLAAVWSRESGTFTCYINGERVAMRGDAVLNVKAAERAELTLGGDPDGGYFFGTIADLAIFERALTPAEVTALARSVAPEFTAPENLPGFHVFVTDPYSNRPIVPESYLDASLLNTVVSVTMARGEYESASLVLRSALDHAAVQMKVSELAGPGGAVIPSENVDLKLVKCWYQGPFAWRNEAPGKEPNVMVPELLLNDYYLLVVDEKQEKNFLRLGKSGAPDVTYFDVSDKTDNNNFWQVPLSIAEFPIYDAETLQPLPLFAGRNQQFYLTVNTSETTVPGDYTGTITVGEDGKTLVTLALKVTVLPFVLAEGCTFYDLDKPFRSSVYYVSTMQPDDQASIRNGARSEAQMRKEMENLKAHGVLWPLDTSLNAGDIGLPLYRDLLRRELRLRAETGLKTRPIYLNSNPNVGLAVTEPTPENLAEVTARTTMVMDIVEEVLGHRDVYFYGQDEAKAEEAERQKPFFRAIQAAGARVFNSGFRAETIPPGTYALAGDVMDLLICAAEPAPEEAALWHAKGHDIWNYAYPQSATENPAAYRRSGLVIYKSNYDGISTFCYWMNFGHPWNDFDSTIQREMNFVYPTADGVVDTVHFAGYREGFDDIRYATTMLQAARDARAFGDPAGIALADKAEKFLAERNVLYADMNETRAVVIDYIMQLQQWHK